MFAAALVLLISQLTALSATDDLRSLQAEFSRWRQMDAPEFTSETGIHTYDNTVDNFGMASIPSRKSTVDSFIRRLEGINKTSLTVQESYGYDVFLDTMKSFVNNYRWRFYGALNPLSFLEGSQIDPKFRIGVLKFDTSSDYEKYISRLTLWPEKFQQYITRMETAVKSGNTQHRVSVAKVPGQIDKLLVSNPDKSVFYEPFTTQLDKLSISDEEKKNLRNRAKVGVVDLLSAFRTIKQYLEQDYMSHTRKSYGVLGLKDGKDNYRACLKWHISVDMTPEEVHKTGLREVARISAEIHTIMNKRSYNGTVATFYTQLRDQPQFHVNSRNQLLEMYKHMIYHRIYPEIHRIFKNIPNLNVSVEPMAFDGPGGMYAQGTPDGSRPGVFQVNLMRPRDTNTFSMMALTLHETIPGHHLQSIYAITSGLPGFQKNIEYEKYFEVPFHFPFYTAYTEGWGLYAESLGEYLGLYKDDNELLGRYGEEIFRACRLVVDTGIHYFGWSRDRAINYMAAHTPAARSEIEIEIDRYITWPGQACAYKIGELKIQELRKRAETILGTKFDIKEFHSQILENGPVPLNLLEKIIDNWIKDTSGTNPVTVPIIPDIIG